MDTQDREFDELYRSKLEGFETAPSADLWPGIAAELNSPGRKKIIRSFLSIAASIMVLIVAGIFFIPKDHPAKPKLSAQNKTVKIFKSLNTIMSAATGKQMVYKKSNSAVKVKDIQNIASANVKKKAGHIYVSNSGSIDNKKIPIKTNEPQAIASLGEKQPDIIKAVVPDETVQLSVKPNTEQPAAFITKPVHLAALLPDAGKIDSVSVKSRRKIHNLGDLVNLVVAKVDKRRDKIIEFSDNDDGGSNITGINLGIIKIKKGE